MKHRLKIWLRIALAPAAGEWARRLAEIKVRPAPPQEPVDITATINEEPKPAKRTRRTSCR